MPLYLLIASLCSLQAQINFPPDLSVSRLEVVQTIQDDAQTVPLIAGKATAVRAFVRQQGRPEALVAGISVFLRGFREGAELAGSPLRPVNSVITASLEPDRANPVHSQDFILPADWTRAGRIEVRTELRLPPGTAEAPADNNTRQSEVVFTAAAADELRVAWAPVCLTASECPAAGYQHQALARRLLPLADSRLAYQDVAAPPVIWRAGVNDAAGAQGLLNLLRKWRIFLEDTAQRTSFVVGWLPKGTPATEASLQSTGGRAAWIVEQTPALENQRLLFRQLINLPAGGGCEAVTGQPGYDPVAARLVPAGRESATARCADGPAGNPWLSAADAAAYAVPAPVARSTTPEETLIVSGVIRADGTGRLDAAYRSRSTVQTAAADQNGDTCLLVTAGGTDTRYCFALPVTGEAGFVMRLPAAGVTRVRLLRNGVEAAALASADQAPEVSFVSPQDGEQWTGRRTLQWTASDAAGRALTYALLYSNDDGANWLPLALDLRESSYELDTQYLLPGAVRFRVVASAGLDAAQTDSAAVDVPQGARLRLTDSTVNFGNATTGQIAERAVMVANTGTSPLQLAAGEGPAEPFSLGQPLPVRVRAGVEQGVVLRYRPRVPGGETASMSVATSDPDNASAALTLRASVFDRPVPNALLRTSAIDFGQVEVGQSREATVVLGNEGTSALTVSGLSTLNARFSAVSGGFSVPAGEERAITVRFAPAGVGAQTGALNIATNDPTSPTLRVELRGAGSQTLTPRISVSAPALSFPGVTLSQPSAPLAVTVTNTGNGALRVGGLAVSNSVFEVAAPTSLPVVLEPGQRQDVSVRFVPRALGAQSGTLTIESNDADRPRATVELSGTGVATAPSTAPVIRTIAPLTLRAVPTGYNVRFNVAVNGANFAPGATVKWNGQDRPVKVLSPSTLTFELTSADVATPGEFGVMVTNPPPGGGTTAEVKVVVTGEPAVGTVSTAQIQDVNTVGCPSPTLTLSAINRIGLGISALNSSNLECREDGERLSSCTIRLARESGSLLSAVMVFHTSASVADRQKRERDLNFMRGAGLQAIGAMLPTQRMLITYMDNGVRPAAETVEFKEGVNNIGALRDAVNGISAPPIGSGTALYDAIEDGLNRLAEREGRKAMIVFTASGNTYDTRGVPRDLNALLERVRNAAVPIYVVPVGDGLTNESLIAQLYQFASDSGGRLMIDRGSNINQQLSRLMSELDNPHLVNFGSLKQDGQPHRIQVRVTSTDGVMDAARYYNGCPAR